MSQRIQQSLMAILVISILVIVWLPMTLESATLQIDQSLQNAAIVFGLARGLNGVISVLQSTEISVLFATMTIGEILDPLNDLVERFSELMTVALASLALQKLFVELTSSSIFSVFATITGLGVVATMKVGTQFHVSMLKLFCIGVFARLSLTIVVLINGAVDSFVSARIQAPQVSILEETSNSLSKAQIANSRLISALDGKRKVADGLRTKITLTQDGLAEAESRLRLFEGADPCPIWKKPLGQCTEAQEKAAESKSRAKNDVRVVQSELDRLLDELGEAQEEINCLTEKLSGRDCGFWDSFKEGIPDPKEIISSATEKSEGAIMALLNLMAIFVFKSILSPLFFWWLLYFGVRRIYPRSA